MIGMAAADLHLGFRAWHKVEAGRNLRELDVETAWLRVVEAVVEENPEIFTIAGDIFHHPRVSDHAKAAYIDGLLRILRETETIIFVVCGNHDAAKTTDTLTPILLAGEIDPERLKVVTEVKRIRVETWRGNDVCVTCVPFVDLKEARNYELTPHPEAAVNVLCIHAAVRGQASAKLPKFYAGEDSFDVAGAAYEWDVIACGDFHEYRRLHDDALAFYSGSIERTSSNIWDETAEKVVVRYDTSTMELTKIPTGARGMLDFQLEGAGADRVNEELERIRDEERIGGKVVRLKAAEFPREERPKLDWALIRELRGRAAHFYFDLRYAPLVLSDLGDRRERDTKHYTLEWEAVQYAQRLEPAVADRFMDLLGLSSEWEAHKAREAAA